MVQSKFVVRYFCLLDIFVVLFISTWHIYVLPTAYAKDNDNKKAHHLVPCMWDYDANAFYVSKTNTTGMGVLAT